MQVTPASPFGSALTFSPQQAAKIQRTGAASWTNVTLQGPRTLPQLTLPGYTITQVVTNQIHRSGQLSGSNDEITVDQPPDITINTEPEKRRKLYVDGIGATIIAEHVEYLDENGKLVTESLRDSTNKALNKRFVGLDEFLKRSKSTERKQAIIDELENKGLSLDLLAEEVGKDLDPFDLICHVAFDQPPLTRRERADYVRKRNVFPEYGPKARAVLEALLQKYQDQGVINLDDLRVLQIPTFGAMGTPYQLVRQFGKRAHSEHAVHELQSALYQKAS